MDIYLEHYIKSVSVEAKLMIEMSKTMIFPAAIRYQGELATTCASLKAVGYTFDTDTLDKVTALVKELQDATAALEKTLSITSTAGLEGEASASAIMSCRPCWRFARRPTNLSASLPTITGHCRPIRKCCLSNSIPLCTLCGELLPQRSLILYSKVGVL